MPEGVVILCSRMNPFVEAGGNEVVLYGGYMVRRDRIGRWLRGGAGCPCVTQGPDSARLFFRASLEEVGLQL